MFLGHGGVVLQAHGLHRGALIEIPQRPDKHRGRAVLARERLLPGLVARHLLPGIEGLRREQNLHRRPPVTGGKNATSSPSRTGRSGLTYSMFTAAKVF